MTYKIHRDGETKTFEDEEKFNTMCKMLDEANQEYTTTEPESSETKADGGTQIVDHAEGDSTEDTTEVVETQAGTLEESAEAIDELGQELDTDPLSILPSHMKDRIQGTPAVNKRGYAMIAERYGIEVSAEIEVYPWDTEEGRCVAKATATTEDGRTYSGWATACASDGDMSEQLIELAETRSLKRAVSWASGVGIVSYQELSGQLENEL